MNSRFLLPFFFVGIFFSFSQAQTKAQTEVQSQTKERTQTQERPVSLFPETLPSAPETDKQAKASNRQTSAQGSKTGAQETHKRQSARGKQAISSQSLQPMSLSAIGVPLPFASKEGSPKGFPDAISQGFWQRNPQTSNPQTSNPQARIESLALSIPNPLPSKAMADMLRLTLLQAATPPSPDKGQSWLVWRLQTLLRFGLVRSFLNLAAAIPSRTPNPDLQLARLQAFWLEGENKKACSLIKNFLPFAMLDPDHDPAWDKGKIFCHLQNKRDDQAWFAWEVLQEKGAEDAPFSALLTYALAKDVPAEDSPETSSVLELASLSPLHGAMLTWSSFPPARIGIQDPNPSAFWTLARSRHLPPDLRIWAAEQMAYIGVISPAQLASLYRTLPNSVFAGFKAQAEEKRPTTLSRAFFYRQLSLGRPDFSEKAEIIELLHRLFQREGQEIFSAQLLAPFLLGETALGRYEWFAETATRILLLSGGDASSWRELGEIRAQEESWKISLLSTFAKREKGFALENVQEEVRSSALMGKLSFLFVAFGHPPFQELDWSAIALDSPESTDLTPNFMLAGLHQALWYQRFGESLLWSLALLPQGAHSSPLSIALGIQTLLLLQQEKLAREFALEAALSVGL